MQQVGPKQQLRVDTCEETFKTNRCGSMQPKKHEKIVVFKAECLRELIRCMLVNSCVSVIEVLTDNSALRVERRSAGTDTKALNSRADSPKKNRNAFTLC